VSEDRYTRWYRRLNPKRMPYNIDERQAELSDLWPADQQRFRDMVDALSPSLESPQP